MSSTPPHNHFRILYFSSAATYTKTRTEDLPAPLPLTNLFPLLERKYPGINEHILRSCTITINQDYVDVEEEEKEEGWRDDGNVGAEGEGGGRGEARTKVMIKEGDEVAIITPISSG